MVSVDITGLCDPQIVSSNVIDVISLTPVMAAVYFTGASKIGDGVRVVELIKIKDRQLIVKWLGEKCSVRASCCSIKRLFREQVLFVHEYDHFIIFPDNDYINLGTCTELKYPKVNSTDPKYLDIVMCKPRKVSMKLESIKTLEDAAAICPLARRVVNGKPVDERLYVVAVDGEDCLAYTSTGTLSRLCVSDPDRLQIRNTSKLKTEVENHKLVSKNLVTNRSRVLGFSDTGMNDGSINIEQIYNNMPKLLDNESDNNKVIIESNETIIAKIDGSNEIMSNENTVETPVTTEVSTTAAATKSVNIVKVANPINPTTGRPGKGRPPKGWREEQLKKMLEAGSITQVQYDETLASFTK